MDTHVFRVANRLGLADAKNVVVTEQQLQTTIPEPRTDGYEQLTWCGVIDNERLCGEDLGEHWCRKWEYAGGFKWYFLPTERLWLNGEVMRVHRVPYTGAFTPYNVGLNGWAPMLQTVLAF